jgi:tape measure domain-containing protein
MAGGVGALTVSLGLDAADYVQGLNKADQQAKNFANNYGRSIKNANTGNASFVQSLGGATTLLRGLAGATAAAFSIGTFTILSDEYTRFSSQLKLATSSQAEFNAALETVDRISQSAQADLGATTQLYARLTNAFSGTNTSAQQLADITETVSLALKVNGASTNEAASAMLQLSQAFGSGVLRGEEFNAINEAAPALLRQVAKEMGVEYGQLRELASQGKITGDILKEAFSNQEYLNGLRQSSKQTQTVDGALQNLKNTLLLAVGQFNDATGAGNLLAGAIQGVTSSISGLIAITSGKGPDFSKFLPNYKAFQESQKEIEKAQASTKQNILPQGSLMGSVITKDLGSLKQYQEEQKKVAALADNFRKSNEFKDRQAELDKYNAKMKELRDLQDKGLIGEQEAARFRAQFESEIAVKAEKKKESQIEENSTALRLADTYADLLNTAKELNTPPDETEADRLEKQLASVTNIDAATKLYIETMIAQRRATDALTEAEEERRLSIEANAKQQLRDLEEAQREKEQFYKDQALEQKRILEDQKDQYKDLERAVDGFAKNAAASLADFTFGGKTGFSDMVNSFLKDLARLALQKSIFDPIAKQFDGFGTGGSSGGFGGIFGSLFSGLGFANGGTPPIGKASLVGERGPELFVPKVAGTVIPNNKMGGMQTNNVSITINSDGSRGQQGSPSETARQIEAAVVNVLNKQRRQGGVLA